MKKQPTEMIIISIMFISLILTSCIVDTSFAQASTTVFKAISSYGSLSQSSPTNQKTDGIWCQAGSDLTPSQCTFYVSKGISYVYMQVGYWKQDGSITLFPPSQQIRDAVTYAHAAGLKIYAWVLSENTYGSVIDVSASKRQIEINNMVGLVNTYGLDGIADDVESMNPYSYTDLITYYNAATTAMHNLNKEYFTAIISYWGPDMGASIFSTIKVDRIQPMLYGNYPAGKTETVVKQHMDYFVRYSSSPVGLALHSDYPDYYLFSDAMRWVDQQFAAGTPTANFAGIDIFWTCGMTQNQWNTWSNWSTKNYS